MRRFLILCTVIVSLSCSSQNSEKTLDNSQTLSKDTDSVGISTIVSEYRGSLLTSTYDVINSDMEEHKADLKELSDSLAFSTIHNRVFSTLKEKHQHYFSSRTNYELIYSATGDLFQNNKEDKAFIVYDKEYSRISILVYNELQNEYLELFRDIRVRYGLENVNCNYGSAGTIDYQIADELIYQRDYLIKEPLKQIEGTKCKIVDISEDDDFVLESGCLAREFLVNNKTKSLCLPTSAVYNNWECLTYDKIKNEFVVIYGQAFAD